MALKRHECYEALFRIKNERKVDITEQLQLLAANNKVPVAVQKFIEEYSERTLTDFVDVIARSKKFFSNICFNYSDDISTYVKAFASLLIHIKITIDKNPELRESIIQMFDIPKIIRVISDNLLVGDNDKDVLELAKEIKVIFLRDIDSDTAEND